MPPPHRETNAIIIDDSDSDSGNDYRAQATTRPRLVELPVHHINILDASEDGSSSSSDDDSVEEVQHRPRPQAYYYPPIDLEVHRVGNDHVNRDVLIIDDDSDEDRGEVLNPQMTFARIEPRREQAPENNDVPFNIREWNNLQTYGLEGDVNDDSDDDVQEIQPPLPHAAQEGGVLLNNANEPGRRTPQEPLFGYPALPIPDEFGFGDFQELMVPLDLTLPNTPDPPTHVPVIDLDIDDRPIGVRSCTEETCLNQVVEMFPDIARDYVQQLYQEGAPSRESMTDAQYFAMLVSRILDNPKYPRERERRQELKRKREEVEAEDDVKRWEKLERELSGSSYWSQTLKRLNDEFTEIPVTHIKSTLVANQTLFNAYLILAKQERDYETFSPAARLYRHVKARHVKPGAPSGAVEIEAELKAARTKMNTDEARRKTEEDNERLARETNSIGECNVCFDSYPLNRMVHCDGHNAHFSCWSCFKIYVDTQIGQSKGKLTCMDMSGCDGSWTHQILQSVLDTKVFARLEFLQFQDSIRTAGIILAECPFCDYKEEYPPVEENKEFRCRNPECERLSCRLCNQVSHTPKTCEEYAKDHKIDSRHAVEEALTLALLRKCNKCKQAFVKQEGCNKITCSACGNVQCYICSQSIKDYQHFDNQGGKCKLYDNTEERHANEVDAAEKAALAKLREENPDLSEEDLRIHLSDRVKNEEQERLKRATDQWNQREGRHAMPAHRYRRAREQLHVLPPNFHGVLNLPPMPPMPVRPVMPPRRGAVHPAMQQPHPPIPPAPVPQLYVPANMQGPLQQQHEHIRQLPLFHHPLPAQQFFNPFVGDIVRHEQPGLGPLPQWPAPHMQMPGPLEQPAGAQQFPVLRNPMRVFAMPEVNAGDRRRDGGQR